MSLSKIDISSNLGHRVTSDLHLELYSDGVPSSVLDFGTPQQPFRKFPKVKRISVQSCPGSDLEQIPESTNRNVENIPEEKDSACQKEFVSCKDPSSSSSKKHESSTVAERTARNAKTHYYTPAVEDDEMPQTPGPSTITKGILATAGFIWLPICSSGRSRTDSMTPDDPYCQALQCSRHHMRRDALAHPLFIHRMPQETRERIQEDVRVRKSSFTRKVSQYFKGVVNMEDYEVDLI